MSSAVAHPNCCSLVHNIFVIFILKKDKNMRDRKEITVPAFSFILNSLHHLFRVVNVRERFTKYPASLLLTPTPGESHFEKGIR